MGVDFNSSEIPQGISDACFTSERSHLIAFRRLAFLPIRSILITKIAPTVPAHAGDPRLPPRPLLVPKALRLPERRGLLHQHGLRPRVRRDRGLHARAQGPHHARQPAGRSVLVWRAFMNTTESPLPRVTRVCIEVCLSPYIYPILNL